MISGAQESAATTTISSRDGALEIKTNNDQPQVHQRPLILLQDNQDMPSLTMTDQGSRLWGSFLIRMCFFGIIVANAREMMIWVVATLLPDLNTHPSTTIALSDTSSRTVTHPFIRIFWNRKLEKSPGESAERHWLLKPPNIIILQCRLRKPPNKSAEQHWLRKPPNISMQQCRLQIQRPTETIDSILNVGATAANAAISRNLPNLSQSAGN